MFNSKVFVAEFIGTFALVFFGAGAAVAHAAPLGVALAHGLTLAVMVYVFGSISGTHINPAVTFGLALNKTIQWAEAWTYWGAQFAGAIVAAFVLDQAGDIDHAFTTGTLTTHNPLAAAGIEAVLTFFLVNTILHTAVAGKAGKFAGWAIGTTLTVAILGGGWMTGASLNPARTFGPALFGPSVADPYTYLIYFAGPLLGAAVAVMVYRFLASPDPAMAAAPVAKAKRPAAKKK